MNVTQTFGNYVDKLSENHPARAQWLLKKGWEAMGLKMKVAPNREMIPAHQYLASMMMDVMCAPLKHPERACIVSVFVPCEILQEFGLIPYSLEGYSCYLAATELGGSCIQEAESEGISETLCSYHRLFVGAAYKELLPRPECVVYTNLTCDANLLTFRRMADYYQVPSFMIDVPFRQDEESLRYVERQLRDLVAFLEKVTGRTVGEDQIRNRTRRSRECMRKYIRYQKERAGKYIPTDLCSPMYEFVTNNILLGTKEEEKYVNMLLRDVKKAPPHQGKRIFFVHTIPYWMKSLRKSLYMTPKAQIVGCDLAMSCDTHYDPDKPFEAMAYRMVNNHVNGSVQRRIRAAIKKAQMVHADGVIWFNHWGCKHTLGGAQLAREAFEKKGIPLLILDGDGCNHAYGGEGQTSTRVEAFLEMLEVKEDA